ncbi:MAG: glycoside hydrolase family 3 C-terminal domain-containing protein [Clostridiales bacterium]|nr:glycoside hydrolase family 3 C-terminal domain-containing protein [Clostridiales bacterium]
MLPYQDASRAPAERARDLCARLSLAEKAGQLTQRLYGFHSVLRQGESLSLSEDFRSEVRHWGGLGTLYGLYRADPWSGRDWENGLSGPLAVRAYNLAQRYVIEHSRFGIPMLLSSECPHGHQALDGYLLPVNLAVGATFDPELLRAAGEVCGKQLKELGVDLALVSALDILRDPRWGRSEECYGEDPLHAARFARAIIQGIQSQGVAVAVKHFCAQGETTGGINASAARIGPRELREIHLPVAKAACEAGAAAFMAAYNEIDGAPCHMNAGLLTGILREEYGFDGVVMADGCAIDRLDALTRDNVRSGALALEAGVDIGLWDTGFSRLPEAVEKGYVSEKLLDRAVIRVLKLKFERGLFERPYLPEGRSPTHFSPSAFPQSHELSRQSLILLKNNGLLPLRAPRAVAVIGPSANDVYRQLGDYSPPVRRGDAATLLDGLRLTAPGSTLLTDGGLDPARAAALAAQADVTVLALGGSSSRFGQVRFDANGAALTAAGQMDCGEGMDCGSLSLPAGQQTLFQAVRSSAKRLVTVLIAGRPYAIADIARDTDALLYCFYPGPWGGLAIAEALFGRFSPSGRLPVSIPRHAGQLPVYYNAKAGVIPMSYRDLPATPLFAFGEGMGYGRLVYSDIALRRFPLRPGQAAGEDAPLCEVRMRVRNAGTLAEYAVPMLFVSILQADVTCRVAELKDFCKASIPPGGERELCLVLRARDLTVWNRRMQPQLAASCVRLCLRDGFHTLWEETAGFTD